jgi:hypothetical protein
MTTAVSMVTIRSFEVMYDTFDVDRSCARFLPKSKYNKDKSNSTQYFIVKSRDSSVGIALGYGLDYRGSKVRFPAGAGNFPLHHRVQNGFGAHPASYPMGTRGSFPGDKAAGT